MSDLLHDLIFRAAERTPQARAVSARKADSDYEALARAVGRTASGLVSLGLGRQQRVAVYLPKQLESVVAMAAACAAGGVFVPVNPVLKPAQVAHILADCDVAMLITSAARAASLAGVLADCPALKHVICVDAQEPDGLPGQVSVCGFDALAEGSGRTHRVIDDDMASILYTSGSTGRPKGVVLSHRNMVTGARSVASYLNNRADDRLLAVLPFSFDYGFSQLSTAWTCGASVHLLDYLLPRDVIRTVAREGITGLAGVPPLWNQICRLPWPPDAVDSLRYITNSGGAMPGATLTALRSALPESRVFLMYGLTEAFRSTYLPPSEVDRRPDSMGKAIPNAEILVVRPDGTPCEPDEPGELVHRGALVARGYWNDEEKTRARFRPVPGQDPGLVIPEIAVWSGDTVRADQEGFLYFVGRRDEMIKTSGYRVSPTEVEEVLYASGLVADAVVLGPSHPELGQALLVVATPLQSPGDTEALMQHCREQLANYMVPAAVEWRDSLPRNPNGKLDRKTLADACADFFQARRAS